MKVVETCDCCQGKGILPDIFENESGCFNCSGTGTLKYDTDDAPADEKNSESPNGVIAGTAVDSGLERVNTGTLVFGLDGIPQSKP
jgi:hypothetical protein